MGRISLSYKFDAITLALTLGDYFSPRKRPAEVIKTIYQERVLLFAISCLHKICLPDYGQSGFFLCVTSICSLFFCQHKIEAKIQKRKTIYLQVIKTVSRTMVGFQKSISLKEILFISSYVNSNRDKQTRRTRNYKWVQSFSTLQDLMPPM